MIELKNITLDYPTYKGPHRVLDGISLAIERGEKIAVLGRNGAGKSTLIKVIGGIIAPSSGEIRHAMSLSWPIGFNGGFNQNLTGLDNVRFIARLYDKPFDELYAFAEDFAELGEHMKMEVGTYSTGMRARLAFGLSLGIEFDCYLIDEVMAAGDARFQRKCRFEILERRKDRAMIMASHDVNLVREFCTYALVLKEGRGKIFDDLDFALAIYNGL